MKSWRARSSLLALTLWSALPAEGGVTEHLNMLPDSGVKISISSLEQLPRAGYVPFRVTIDNRSGATRTWNFSFQNSVGSGPQTGRSGAEQSVRVEHDRVGVMDVLMPLISAPRESHNYRRPTIEVTGYGVSRTNVHFPFAYNRKGKPETVFVAMSEKLGSRSWDTLQKDLEARGHDLVGSTVEMSSLADDWRGLLGFGCLWITDAEYSDLSAGQRNAIKEWLLQGGKMFLCVENFPKRPVADFVFEKTDWVNQARAGLGKVELVQWDGKELSLPDTEDTIQALSSPLEDQLNGYDASWGLARSAGDLQFNVPFLAIFIGVFAMVVGPINLFVFAAPGRRHRLFWTTPLISVVASVLLALVIVVQDGFGGSGSRIVLTHLVPEQKKAVVMQEQVARTGVLLSRNFRTVDDVFLTPVALGRDRDREKSRGYDQSGKSYAGEWFTSRSVQAHFAEGILPTRAEVQLLNSSEISETTPPVVLSSIPATLSRIELLDREGRSWRGENVRTGQRTTLQRHTGIASIGASFADAGAGSLLNLAYARGADRRGYFYAIAEDAPFLETLPSIRWKKQAAYYVGPVTTNP